MCTYCWKKLKHWGRHNRQFLKPISTFFIVMFQSPSLFWSSSYIPFWRYVVHQTHGHNGFKLFGDLETSFGTENWSSIILVDFIAFLYLEDKESKNLITCAPFPYFVYLCILSRYPLYISPSPSFLYQSFISPWLHKVALSLSLALTHWVHLVFPILYNQVYHVELT